MEWIRFVIITIAFFARIFGKNHPISYESTKPLYSTYTYLHYILIFTFIHTYTSCEKKYDNYYSNNEHTKIFVILLLRSHIHIYFYGDNRMNKREGTSNHRFSQKSRLISKYIGPNKRLIVLTPF